MQFNIRINESSLDIGQIESALGEIDPAAVVDLDAVSRMLRVSTIALPGELIDILDRSGCRIALADIELVPSVCCGGCSG